MGMFTPKPFKKFCKTLKKWVTVTPGPQPYDSAKVFGARNELKKRPFYHERASADPTRYILPQ